MLRRGLVLRLAGFRPGVTRVSVRVARRVVGTSRAKVGPDGRATARVRFTRRTRRTLSRRRSVTFTVKAGTVRRTVRVTR